VQRIERFLVEQTQLAAIESRLHALGVEDAPLQAGDKGQLDEKSALIRIDNAGIALNMLLDKQCHELSFDWLSGEVGFRAQRVSKSNELLARALGVKPNYRPWVVDATAGMGRDSWIMACLGCQVTMLERAWPVALLLDDVLKRTQASAIGGEIARRNQLRFANAGNVLSQIDAEVIYLDPMFPERKKSALVKKEMRLFKRLVGDDADADGLLQSALEAPVKRVVVKRPKGAPHLNDEAPHHQIQGKKFRFDVYLNTLNRD